MKFAAIIPARLNSTRLPRKLLKDLGGKSVIEQTYWAAVKTKLFSQVIVVTDSAEIGKLLQESNIPFFISNKEHQTGSDRIAEIAPQVDADILVNVQGDEPFITREALSPLLKIYKDDSKTEIDLVTLCYKITDTQAIENPNHVKVIRDQSDFALYFSRAAIPYDRDQTGVETYKHIGIYAFRKQALVDFATLEQTPLEKAEKIECIRFLEHGYRIKMVVTDEMPISIDTLEDYEKAKRLWPN